MRKYQSTQSRHLTYCVIYVYRTGRVTDSYAGYMAKDELEKVLVEATANENWNISNSKLLQIADATYNM